MQDQNNGSCGARRPTSAHSRDKATPLLGLCKRLYVAAIRFVQDVRQILGRYTEGFSGVRPRLCARGYVDSPDRISFPSSRVTASLVSTRTATGTLSWSRHSMSS